MLYKHHFLAIQIQTPLRNNQGGGHPCGEGAWTCLCFEIEEAFGPYSNLDLFECVIKNGGWLFFFFNDSRHDLDTSLFAVQ